MALAAIRRRLVALEVGVVLEGVLLGADEVAGAEERRQQQGGRSERLVYRKSAEMKGDVTLLAGVEAGSEGWRHQLDCRYGGTAETETEKSTPMPK